MALMSPTDSMFLIGESREQPMHVGSLQLFRPPPDTPPGYLRENYEQLLSATDVATPFRRRPYRSFSTFGQWTWVDDEDVDLEHHVRHSALPVPGRIRELLADDAAYDALLKITQETEELSDSISDVERKLLTYKETP